MPMFPINSSGLNHPATKFIEPKWRRKIDNQAAIYHARVRS